MNNNSGIYVTVDNILYDKIRNYAEKHDMRFSDVIRLAVEKGIGILEENKDKINNNNANNIAASLVAINETLQNTNQALEQLTNSIYLK